jgi:hypothetical protein
MNLAQRTHRQPPPVAHSPPVPDELLQLSRAQLLRHHARTPQPPAQTRQYIGVILRSPSRVAKPDHLHPERHPERVHHSANGPSGTKGYHATSIAVMFGLLRESAEGDGATSQLWRLYVRTATIHQGGYARPGITEDPG